MIRRSRHIHRCLRRAEVGLTLVEVAVAGLLLAVVVGALIPLLSIGQQTWFQSRGTEEIEFNARFALDSLVSTIRAAQSLQVISPTDIRLTYFFGDGTTQLEEYILDTTTNELQYRRNTDSPAPFAGPFRSMSVVCFDNTNATTACTTVASVRSVQISLVAMDPQGVVPDMNFTARTFVQYP